MKETSYTMFEYDKMTPSELDDLTDEYYNHDKKLSIIFENGPGGCCPVQAEGTINGYPFYFRSRHEHWSIRIASDKDKDPYDDDAWYFIEEYPLKEGEEYPTVAAGHATKEECIEFIEKAAKKYLDINNS